MRAGTDDRRVMVGMDRELVAIGMGNGGGAQHTGSMCLLTRRLGVLPVAETIHEACIDPATLTGRTLYDHRDKEPFLGTVFAPTRDPASSPSPSTSVGSSSPRAGRLCSGPTRTPRGRQAWLDNGLVIVAHRRGYRVEIEAALQRGTLALLHQDIMQGPFLAIAARVPETLTIPTFRRDADRPLAGRDEPGCVFTVPSHQSDFEALAPAFRRQSCPRRLASTLVTSYRTGPGSVTFRRAPMTASRERTGHQAASGMRFRSLSRVMG